MSIYGTIRSYNEFDYLLEERVYYTIQGRWKIIEGMVDNKFISHYHVLPQYIKRKYDVIKDAPKPKLIRPKAVYDNKLRYDYP